MLPFIGYFAVTAVCLAQIAHDAAASALIVGAVGFTVLFVSDKFARPMLMAKGARLDFLGALMGTVGGLQSFGLLGIFLGPVIVAVGKAIFDEWLTHSSPVPPNTDVSLRRSRDNFTAEAISTALADPPPPEGSYSRARAQSPRA